MQTNFDFGVAQLGAYLEGKVAGFRVPLTAERFAGGQSNPTFKIIAASGEYALAGPGGIDRRALGIPSEEDYVALYCQRMGLESIPNWNF